MSIVESWDDESTRQLWISLLANFIAVALIYLLIKLWRKR